MEKYKQDLSPLLAELAQSIRLITLCIEKHLPSSVTDEMRLRVERRLRIVEDAVGTASK